MMSTTRVVTTEPLCGSCDHRRHLGFAALAAMVGRNERLRAMVTSAPNFCTCNVFTPSAITLREAHVCLHTDPSTSHCTSRDFVTSPQADAPRALLLFRSSQPQWLRDQLPRPCASPLNVNRRQRRCNARSSRRRWRRSVA